MKCGSNLHVDVFNFRRRCATIEGGSFKCEDHSLPFSNVLPLCPSVDDMRVLHSMKKSKEDLLFIPPRWEDDKVSAVMIFSSIINVRNFSILIRCSFFNTFSFWNRSFQLCANAFTIIRNRVRQLYEYVKRSTISIRVSSDDNNNYCKARFFRSLFRKWNTLVRCTFAGFLL
jgi:hypothetical protein